MNPTLLLWFPLLLLFLSAIISIAVERNSKDLCLKKFHNAFVILFMKDGSTLWGKMIVYPDCIELEYNQPKEMDDNRKKVSYVLYNKKIAEIQAVYRPAPHPDSPERNDWSDAMAKLNHPGFIEKTNRSFRVFYSMLRDAFSQSIGVALGMVKQRNQLMQQVSTAEKHANEVGQTLLKIAPNAYEPVLEKYRGNEVVVETLIQDEVKETRGVMDDYSMSYLLVRGVTTPKNIIPKELSNVYTDDCDLILTRSSSIVRHKLIQA